MRIKTALVALAAVLFPACTFAQTAPAPSKVAMIDISRAVLSTAEGKRDLEALDKKFEPRRTALQQQGTEMQGLQKQLSDGGSKLTEDQRGELVRNIQQKQLALQHASEDAQSDYRREQGEIVGRVLKKMAPVIDKYARDNNFTMIFDAQFWPSGPVLWASGSAADITAAIVTAYNAQPGSAPTAAPGNGSTTNDIHDR
jgi:outer membrane protein